MNLKDNILNRIDELLKKELDRVSLVEAAEISLAVTNIFETIYGTRSPQLDMVETARNHAFDRSEPDFYKRLLLVQQLHGYLRELKAAIMEGRIANIQVEARGEVLGDFLALAHETLEAGEKDVAAVLACAALEDALKRYASDLGLEVQDKDMSQVVNALKAAQVIRRPQGKVLDGYVQVRNKAFHAEWNAVDAASVEGIIGYTQGFLAKQSASPIPAYDPSDPPAEA